MLEFIAWIKRNPTLTITALTVYLYGWTFEYEKGYLDTFDIPSDYITIDFNTMLIDVDKIAGTIMGVYLVFSIIKLILVKLTAKFPDYIEFVNIISRLGASILLVYIAVPIPNVFIKYYAIGCLTIFVIFLILVLFPGFIKKFLNIRGMNCRK